MIDLYLREKSERARAKRHKVRKASKGSLVDQFVDILFPDTVQCSKMLGPQKKRDARQEAKKRFDNYLKAGKPWARLVEHFSVGIIFLIPEDLTNDEWVIKLSDTEMFSIPRLSFIMLYLLMLNVQYSEA
jgi:hypothetical protein